MGRVYFPPLRKMFDPRIYRAALLPAVAAFVLMMFSLERIPPALEQPVASPEFDAAIVGVIERFGQPRILCYDYTKVLKILCKQGMSAEDAVEWYEFNIIGAWMGDETPCFLHRPSTR